MWIPTPDDFRTTAKVLRYTARLMEAMPWWERWTYPHETLRKHADIFEDRADISPNEKAER